MLASRLGASQLLIQPVEDKEGGLRMCLIPDEKERGGVAITHPFEPRHGMPRQRLLGPCGAVKATVTTFMSA